MNIVEARTKISAAKAQMQRVMDAASDPDPEDAVMWAFYAYENCIVAVAELQGRRWYPNHRQKADLARFLYFDGLVSRDVGAELEELNSLRKDVAYGDPGEELLNKDLEDVSLNSKNSLMILRRGLRRAHEPNSGS